MYAKLVYRGEIFLNFPTNKDIQDAALLAKNGIKEKAIIINIIKLIIDIKETDFNLLFSFTYLQYFAKANINRKLIKICINSGAICFIID